MLAPNFTLPDQHAVMHTLSDYAGKWVVLYFYPKDMTPGCTIEACSFRDNMNRLAQHGAVVLGISADSVARHEKFAKQQSLQFTLLADENHAVCEAYGVWKMKKFMGRSYEGIVRTTVIIDPVGEMVKRYDDVKVSGHVDEVLQDLVDLQEK